ncbi:MAG: Ig-like domain-containing protein [Clostridiales bacterium]|nr:Ig-like domain-containing protein [Clostridiales bacterium]
MKKIIIFIIVAILFINSSMVYGADSIEGKYKGTYKITNLYINNINDALKELKLGISYSEDEEDYQNTKITIQLNNDNTGSFTEYGRSMKTKSITRNGDRILIEFDEGYLGHADEIAISYKLDATIDGDVISGIFYGTIVLTGKLESEGTFSVEKAEGFSLFNRTNEAKDENKEKYKPVTDLLFDTESKEISVGHEEKLKATIFPKEATNKEVIYRTSDSKIIIVNSKGIITAKATGYAKITVISDDNQKINNVMHITVHPNVENVKEGDLEKIREGMTIFHEDKDETKESDVGYFTEFNIDELELDDIARGKDTIEKLKGIAENKPEISVEHKAERREDTQEERDNQKLNIVIAKQPSNEEISTDSYKNNEDFMSKEKEKLKIIRLEKGREAISKIVGEIIDVGSKIASKKVPLIEIISSYVKEDIKERIKDLDGYRKKSDDVIKEQLQKHLSVNSDGFVLKYVKERAGKNMLTKLLVYPINKIFGAKQAQFKEAAFIEYKSLRDRIRKNIESGMSKEKAISSIRNDFVNNDGLETTYDAIENSKPGWSRFMAMRQGGKQSQVVTGTKPEYKSNGKRFKKYEELFQKNLEFVEEGI